MAPTLQDYVKLFKMLPLGQKWSVLKMIQQMVFKKYYYSARAITALLLFGLGRLYYSLQKKKSVKGKLILITGAASGLGRNLACRFGRRGARLALWDRNLAGLEDTKAKVTALGAECHVFEVDLNSRENCYEVAEQTKQQCGKVDILFNNAGVVSGGWITDIPDAKIELTFGVNILAHFWTIKSFLPAMLAENSGHVVTIASAAGCTGLAKMSDYCASKFAAIGLDESLRLELRKRNATGVKTTCIMPFYINTGMFDGVKTKIPLLLPILDEEYACSRIEEAVLKNWAVLKMPWVVYSVPLFGLMPTWAADFLNTTLGINESMDDFKGRSD